MNEKEIRRGRKAIQKIAVRLEKENGYNPKIIICFHQFPINFFEIVPKEYRNDDWLFFRDSLTHVSLIYNEETEKILILNEEHWKDADELLKEEGDKQE